MIFSQTPSKSKCLRTLRKVYPNAEVKPLKSGGVQLTYRVAGEREPRPVLEVVPKGRIGKDALVFAALKAAFYQLGFATSYKPGFPSGKFSFDPIKDFKGPETQLPIELDPAELVGPSDDITVQNAITESNGATPTPGRTYVTSTELQIADPTTGSQS